MRSSRTCTLVVASLLFTVGCATGRVAWDKPGTTEAERRRDVAECAQASLGHEPGRHVLTPVVVDHAAFAKCLEARGYARVR
jgi:hypothetical protein